MLNNQKLLVCDINFIKSNDELIRGNNKSITLQSGTAGTWIVTFKPAADSLKRGTRIILDRINFQLACRLQDSHAERRDYVTVETTGKSKTNLELGPGDKTIAITIEEHDLETGDVITLRIGDRRRGSVGSEVFWSATRGRFTVSVANDSVESARKRIEVEDFTVNITHRREPKAMRFLGPSVVSPGESFSMNLIIFDINRNVVESYTGMIFFDIPEDVSGLPAHFVFTPEERGIKEFSEVKINQPGVFRIGAALENRAVSENQKLACRSNPIVCKPDPEKRVYWGDLHCHGWGDVSMYLMHDNTWKINPHARHEQARRVGRYDYAAPGAMAMPDTPDREEIWEAYEKAYNKNDEPGRYVPFLSMEMHPGKPGDRTLVFREKAEIPVGMREEIEKIYKLYGGRYDAVLECHIGGAVPDFNVFQAEEEDLVEVTSAFANAEWLLQRMLKMGYHPGITGASDLHLGLLGAPRAVETFRGRFGYKNRRLNVRDSGFGSGPVGALIAGSCRRASLWEAIKQRSGYATTGDRIYLSIDACGHCMGEIADLPRRFDVHFTVHAQDTVDRIDLIVGEKLARSFFPKSPDVDLSVPFDRSSMPPGKWFYFRVRQANCEYAWTAPVWFEDGTEAGDTARKWPEWNHAECPEASESPEMLPYLHDLESYLQREGDRDSFREIVPVGISKESMGTSARFISRTAREDYPVTIRWFFEYEIPKIRVDWGYENFGVVDCENGPAL